MKRNIRTYILALTALLLALFLLSSCGGDKEEKPYDCLVTFDYNTAGIAKEAPTNSYLGVKRGGLVGIQPGDNDDFKSAPVDHYYIEGWYTARVAADGSVKTDGSGRVLLDRKWNFKTDTVTEDMTLYAKFIRMRTLTVIDIATGRSVSTQEGKPGDWVLEPDAESGYTVLGYYEDREKTTLFDFDDFQYGDEDKTVYADIRKGEYTVVSTFAQLETALRGDKNIYLTADIDMTGKKWQSFDFSGEFCGNGYKITGLTLDVKCNKNEGSAYGLLFRTLGKTARLSDLTFEDVRMTVSAVNMPEKGKYEVAAIALAVNEGASLTRVTVTGALTYDISKVPTSEVEADFGTPAPDGALTDCRFEITLTGRNG